MGVGVEVAPVRNVAQHRGGAVGQAEAQWNALGRAAQFEPAHVVEQLRQHGGALRRLVEVALELELEQHLLGVEIVVIRRVDLKLEALGPCRLDILFAAGLGEALEQLG
ncbi:hypothetical protein [Methylibium sp.]|uniref:hypothetical protein n=1 Tax=Methylibium sp. TaxID=2067992 RepID=UPI00286C1858|nr:hypothetical protein [Methylibium sp.]